MIDKLLTLPQAAEALHLSIDTLRYWRATGTGPTSIKIGRRVMYRETDIQRYIEAQFATASA